MFISFYTKIDFHTKNKIIEFLYFIEYNILSVAMKQKWFFEN